MKNLYRLFTGLTVVSLLLFNSCVPEDEIVIDKALLLTDGAWKFKEVDDNDDFVKDFYEGLYAGRVIDFNSDGTFSQNLAIYNSTGDWSLNANQTLLMYDVGSTEAEEWEILSISSTELFYEVDFSGTMVKIRYTH